MPRPRKAGLEYYYKGVHDFDDIGMTELLLKYGPMGYCIYDVVLSKVYESGYYLEISLDRLACYVIKTIGNRWIRDKSVALQVIRYCAEIGLFDDALMKQSVITSASIQQHYAVVTARSKADKTKYWLLGGSEKKERPAEQPDLPVQEVFAAKTDVYPVQTPESPENMPQSKVNKRKENKSKAKQTKAKQSAVETAAFSPSAAAFAAAMPPAEAEEVREAEADEARVIEERYESISGRQFRKADMAALQEMREEGADDGLILYAMDQVSERGNTDVGSMRYFLPIVREALCKNKNRHKNKDSPDAAKKAAQSGKSNRMPETCEVSEIESVLDDEWLTIVSQYPPMSDEDYV